MVACSCGLSFPRGVPGFLETCEKKDIQKKGKESGKRNN